MSKVQVQRLHSLTGHRDAVYNLQPSHARDQIFSASGDGMIVQWNLSHPEEGQLIARLPNSVYALHYDHARKVLIAGHNYDGIHVLDPENKKEIASLQLTDSAIFDIQSAGNAWFVACGDGSIYRINPDGMRIVKHYRGSEKSARCIDYNKVTGEIAVGYSDHFVRVFDAELELKKEWRAHTNSVFTVRFSPDGKSLFTGSRDARLKLWDSEKFELIEEVVAHLFAINHLDFSPDGKHFVTCSMDKSIKVWDREEMKLLKVIDRARHAGHGTSVNRLLWTDFNNQLLSASDDRTISVWQIIF